MYHVVGTGLTALIIYLLSYFLYRQSFYSIQFHRKLWNIILAIAFLSTALAGLFLALQVNYKWNIPFVKTILKWHVEFGIGLSFTGIAHFLWHIPYFTGIFKKSRVPAEVIEEISTPVDIGLNLFVIGFISTSVQLLLLKEIINISGGYELIAGTFLASWLTGSAAGSAMAKNSKLTDLRRINMIFSLGPLISLILMLLLTRIFLKPGETPSFLAGIIFTFLVLIPFCLISGFTFARLLTAGYKSKNYIPGKSFSIETTGGIVAGILVTLFGSGKINTYELLALIIIMGLSYTFISSRLSRKTSLIMKLLTLLAVILIFIFPPDHFFRHWLLRSVKVTATIDTPYGNITTGEYGNDPATYYNHRLLAYNNDVAEREEDIHYALLQADHPGAVLLISGDPRSRVPEILKYPVKKIVYVERDPELIRIGIPDKSPVAEQLETENDDALSYIRSSQESFDAVIDLLPPPSSLMINRYYTREFFREVKQKLNPAAVFACSPGTNPGYLNREGIRYFSSIFNTLKAEFRNVIIINGTKLYYLASDGELSDSICKLVRQRGITNSYVGPDYLSDDLISAKTAEITGQMDSSVKINRAGLPVACFYYQAFDLTKSLPEKTPAIALLAVLFILPVIGVRRRNLQMYFSALSLAGFEIILLLMLQTAAGNMYELTGIIIAGIMAGLASGAIFRLPGSKGRARLLASGMLVIIYLMSALVVPFLISMSSRIAVSILLVICGFLAAFVTGQIFRQMTTGEILFGESAAVYSSDLAGSAAGFILFTGLAVPLLGIRGSAFLLPLLIIAGFVVSASFNKR